MPVLRSSPCSGGWRREALRKKLPSSGGRGRGESKGYRLPAAYVIHTVGPVWRGGQRDFWKRTRPSPKWSSSASEKRSLTRTGKGPKKFRDKKQPRKHETGFPSNLSCLQIFVLSCCHFSVLLFFLQSLTFCLLYSVSSILSIFYHCFSFHSLYALKGRIIPKNGIMYMAATVGSRGVKNSELKKMIRTLFMTPRQMTAEI